MIFNIESNLNLNDAAFYSPLLFFVRSIFFDPKKMCVSHSLFSPPVSNSRWSTQLVLKQKNPDRTLLINEEQKDNGPQPFFPIFDEAGKHFNEPIKFNRKKKLYTMIKIAITAVFPNLNTRIFSPTVELTNKKMFKAGKYKHVLVYSG